MGHALCPGGMISDRAPIHPQHLPQAQVATDLLVDESTSKTEAVSGIFDGADVDPLCHTTCEFQTVLEQSLELLASGVRKRFPGSKL